MKLLKLFFVEKQVVDRVLIVIVGGFVNKAQQAFGNSLSFVTVLNNKTESQESSRRAFLHCKSEIANRLMKHFTLNRVGVYVTVLVVCLDGALSGDMSRVCPMPARIGTSRPP